MKLAPDFWKSKTTAAAIGSVVLALIAGATHTISWHDAAAAIQTAVFGAFIRDTIAKGLTNG